MNFIPLFIDPNGARSILSAAQWLQGTLLGTVATVVAVIAVACVSFMMLTGRINWRHGALVILGCFILFGAECVVIKLGSASLIDMIHFIKSGESFELQY